MCSIVSPSVPRFWPERLKSPNSVGVSMSLLVHQSAVLMLKAVLLLKAVLMLNINICKPCLHMSCHGSMMGDLKVLHPQRGLRGRGAGLRRIDSTVDGSSLPGSATCINLLSPESAYNLLNMFPWIAEVKGSLNYFLFLGGKTRSDSHCRCPDVRWGAKYLCIHTVSRVNPQVVENRR